MQQELGPATLEPMLPPASLKRKVPGGPAPQAPDRRAGQVRRDMAADEMSPFVVAAFRRHPHINNVLTHISGGDWSRVDQALRAILAPRGGGRSLSPLAQNLLELMCANRGITGRILGPYYREFLVAFLGERAARRLIARVTRRYTDVRAAARESVPRQPAVEPQGRTK